jgi:hypothetical protein
MRGINQLYGVDSFLTVRYLFSWPSYSPSFYVGQSFVVLVIKFAPRSVSKNTIPVYEQIFPFLDRVGPFQLI